MIFTIVHVTLFLLYATAALCALIVSNKLLRLIRLGNKLLMNLSFANRKAASLEENLSRTIFEFKKSQEVKRRPGRPKKYKDMSTTNKEK